MADPNWNKGFYYDGMPPHTGMKLARRRIPFNCMLLSALTDNSTLEIGYHHLPIWPEWDLRFGRKFRPPSELPARNTPVSGPRIPALCPDFLIETYLDHQGEQFCLKYDANSLIYISKAMDLFDMTLSSLQGLNLTRKPLAPHRLPPLHLSQPYPIPTITGRSCLIPSHTLRPRTLQLTFLIWLRG